jgi:aspartyl protease family protein
MSGIGDFDAARLFYLTALLLLVLSAVFATYRNRMGVGLQHAAIWTLIFLGAVIAYGFRDTLEVQLFGSTAPQVVEQGVALRRGGDGHFHARAEVNGVAVEFLVDTGASSVVLSRRDAQRVGLDPERLVFSQPAQTANGLVYSAPVTLDVLRLGPFEDRNVPATVNGGDLDVSLMGMSYLRRFARVTVEGERMLLER